MTPAGEGVTYAARLTPSGVGAVATVALRGPRAWDIVRELFRPRRSGSWPLESVDPGRFWLGRILESDSHVGDEVVLAVKQVEPVPCAEIHCHGGREAVRLLMETFVARGAVECAWEDIEPRSAANVFRAQAARALAEAPTVRTASILLDQYQGAFARAVGELRTALERNDADAALGKLERLASQARVGRHLTVPWRVAVLGAPNVGKSSLVNALAGYERALVAPTPGTTRDVVTTVVALDGWPVELCDTAGLRNAAEAVERAGVERARGVAATADLRLWVLDAAAAPVWPSDLGAVRLIVNKTDLAPVWDTEQAGDAVFVSARTGAGMPALAASLSCWLVPEAPPPGEPMPFTPDLADLVEQALASGRAGQWENARRLIAEPPADA